MQESKMRRIAITTNEISCDFDYAIQVGTAWGLTAFELKQVWDGARIPRIDRAQKDKIIRTVKDKGLTVSAVSPGAFITKRADPMYERYRREFLPATIQLATELSCKILILICPLREQGDPVDHIPEWVISLMRECTAMAADAGMTVCLENLHGTFADTIANTLATLEGVGMDSFRLNWDPGNAAIVERKGIFPEGYERLKSYVHHLHMKDVTPNEDPSHRSFCTLGNGIIDWKGQVKALVKDGFKGYFTIETHTVPLEESSKKNLEWLKKNLPL